MEKSLAMLERNHLRQQEHLNTIYEKVPVQAKDGVLNAISRSNNGLENAIQKVQGEHHKEEFKENLKALKMKPSIE